MSARFFEERSDQSEVKARIVQKYFFAWANVIMPTAERRDRKIAYIDLYAGPGRYRDGAASTPLLVLQHAIAHPKMRQMLVALFNDKDENNTATLEKEIASLPGVSNLKFYPSVMCGEVDQDAETYFTETRIIPSFSFIDPFGYKGLSLKIIKGVIKDWGCDCVFFFNYNRINAGINNPVVEKHMNALFTEERANHLRATLTGKSPALREAAILEALVEEIRSLGGKYVLPFTFSRESSSRTSHKLIFVSKHFRGYDIMKGVMAKESSTLEQGVASFRYSPADETMPYLFPLTRPLDELREQLLRTYAGQTWTRDGLYEDHSVNTPYVKSNYNELLQKLEGEGVISVSSEKANRRKGTYADHVKITFPSSEV